MVKSVELHPASVLCADPHGRGGQAVVLPSDHQRGEHRRAVSPPPASLRRRAAVDGLLGRFRRLDPMHHLHFLFVGSRVGEGRLEEVVVESAVRHGAVETADGPDANGKGFGLQWPPDVVVALGLQRQRRRRAETLRLRLVEPPPLLPPGSLSILHNSCWS